MYEALWFVGGMAVGQFALIIALALSHRADGSSRWD